MVQFCHNSFRNSLPHTYNSNFRMWVYIYPRHMGLTDKHPWVLEAQARWWRRGQCCYSVCYKDLCRSIGPCTHRLFEIKQNMH